VQGELERVLTNLYRIEVHTTCAGRTDAGVHARGQVIHFDAPTDHPDIDSARINRALPDDIRIRDLETAPEGFDARFSAIWRRYTYRVCDDLDGPHPLERTSVLAWTMLLDLDRMNEAAHALIGTHDFAAFCKWREGATTIRELQHLRWERDEDRNAVMTIQADAFCHSMVRSIVGAMLPVGDGRKPVTWPGELVHAAQRESGVTVMPPHPLVLEQVGYPPDAELAARQQETRALRTFR
jgi:tRNA pseudouridine38-40 synthase